MNFMFCNPRQQLKQNTTKNKWTKESAFLSAPVYTTIKSASAFEKQQPQKNGQENNHDSETEQETCNGAREISSSNYDGDSSTTTLDVFDCDSRTNGGVIIPPFLQPFLGGLDFFPLPQSSPAEKPEMKAEENRAESPLVPKLTPSCDGSDDDEDDDNSLVTVSFLEEGAEGELGEIPKKNKLQSCRHHHRDDELADADPSSLTSSQSMSEKYMSTHEGEEAVEKSSNSENGSDTTSTDRGENLSIQPCTKQDDYVEQNEEEVKGLETFLLGASSLEVDVQEAKYQLVPEEIDEEKEEEKNEKEEQKQVVESGGKSDLETPVTNPTLSKKEDSEQQAMLLENINQCDLATQEGEEKEVKDGDEQEPETSNGKVNPVTLPMVALPFQGHTQEQSAERSEDTKTRDQGAREEAHDSVGGSGDGGGNVSDAHTYNDDDDDVYDDESSTSSSGSSSTITIDLMMDNYGRGGTLTAESPGIFDQPFQLWVASRRAESSRGLLVEEETTTNGAYDESSTDVTHSHSFHYSFPAIATLPATAIQTHKMGITSAAENHQRFPSLGDVSELEPYECVSDDYDDFLECLVFEEDMIHHDNDDGEDDEDDFDSAHGPPSIVSKSEPKTTSDEELSRLHGIVDYFTADIETAGLMLANEEKEQNNDCPNVPTSTLREHNLFATESKLMEAPEIFDKTTDMMVPTTISETTESKEEVEKEDRGELQLEKQHVEPAKAAACSVLSSVSSIISVKEIHEGEEDSDEVQITKNDGDTDVATASVPSSTLALSFSSSVSSPSSKSQGKVILLKSPSSEFESAETANCPAVEKEGNCGNETKMAIQMKVDSCDTSEFNSKAKDKVDSEGETQNPLMATATVAVECSDLSRSPYAVFVEEFPKDEEEDDHEMLHHNQDVLHHNSVCCENNQVTDVTTASSVSSFTGETSSSPEGSQTHDSINTSIQSKFDEESDRRASVVSGLTDNTSRGVHADTAVPSKETCTTGTTTTTPNSEPSTTASPSSEKEWLETDTIAEKWDEITTNWGKISGRVEGCTNNESESIFRQKRKENKSVWQSPTTVTSMLTSPTFDTQVTIYHGATTDAKKNSKFNLNERNISLDDIVLSEVDIAMILDKAAVTKDISGPERGDKNTSSVSSRKSFLPKPSKSFKVKNSFSSTKVTAAERKALETTRKGLGTTSVSRIPTPKTRRSVRKAERKALENTRKGSGTASVSRIPTRKTQLSVRRPMGSARNCFACSQSVGSTGAAKRNMHTGDKRAGNKEENRLDNLVALDAEQGPLSKDGPDRSKAEELAELVLQLDMIVHRIRELSVP